MSIEFILRIIGMFVMGGCGWYLGNMVGNLLDLPAIFWGLIFTLIGALTGLIITPFLTTRPFKRIRETVLQLSTQTMFSAMLGLIVGLIIAALVSFPLSLMPAPLGHWFPFIGAVLFGYFGVIVFVLREREIMGMFRNRFNINKVGSPARTASLQDGRSVLLDTSVIIDGRIADIARTGFVPGRMIVPAFVLNELQHIADSSDNLRRQRGRRGLDILNRLQKDPDISLRISDIDVERVREVDDKLVVLGKQMKAPILTNDYNLNRVAELQGVHVLNINELANAVKAVYLPGEEMEVNVIQEGKEAGQGVGYLDDGTMVVIEEGKAHIRKTILVTVTKVLQTAAGRMIFARPNGS